MWWMALASLLLSIVALPAASAAQSAAPVTEPSTGLEKELKSKRYVVQPRPDPQAVEQDAEQARQAIEAEQRRDATVKEGTQAPPRRPDLGYDVKSEIQQRNLQRAIGH
jgi:hypothetical protein